MKVKVEEEVKDRVTATTPESSSGETKQSRFDKAVLEKAREVEEGEVASYGSIARAMGCPNYSRHVGFALSKVKKGDDVPWWRIMNSQGKISYRAKDRIGKGTKKSPFTSLQRKLLEKEGHAFSDSGTLVGFHQKLHTFRDSSP